MKDNKLNLIISFFISFFVHTFAVGFLVYVNLNGDDTNISEIKEDGAAFGINFTQIADKNTNQEAAAKAGEISNSSEELRPAMEEQVQEPKEPEPYVSEILEKIENEIKEFDEEQFKQQKEPEKEPKPKKEKTVKKPKQAKQKVKKVEKKNDTNIQKSTKEASFITNAGSNVQANNDVNVIGGNKSSGSATSIQNGGSNLMGEIYAALKKHMTYPQKAVIRKIEGRVIVEFKLLNNNNFEYIRVIKSSGSKILDNHAIQIVNSAKNSLPKAAVGLNIKAPISFDINDLER